MTSHLQPRTIVLPKSSSFHPIRLGLKATLVSNLLILGHVVLTTTAHAASALQLTPNLPTSICTLSALIFLTLLWLTFTLIEGADLSFRSDGESVRDGEKGMVFSRTWVEGLSGLAVLGFWCAYWQDANAVMEAYSHQLAKEFALIPLTYYLVLGTLGLMNLHLLVSLAFYAGRNGARALASRELWEGRMGWWVGRVELGSVLGRGAGNAFTDLDLEKGDLLA